MKKIFFALTLITTVLSCNNKPSQRIISDSSGNINQLTIVIENNLWEGSVGDAIRSIFAAPVDGLPQDEPLFTLSQIPPSVFTGFATKGRGILKIENGAPEIKFLSDVTAKPQRLVLVTGNNTQQLISQLEANGEKMVASFKVKELKEKQRRIKKSLYNSKNIEEALGVSINFPSVYRIAKEEKDFFWIRKDITTGTTNLLVYQIPFDAIQEDDSLITQIVALRDSIGKKHIPGPSEGSYMITEKAYTPFLFKTKIGERITYETKGTWEVYNAFMAGPFINYIIEDKPNNRYVVLDGFAFAPSVEKREYMFELEAIIKSIKFN